MVENKTPELDKARNQVFNSMTAKYTEEGAHAALDAFASVVRAATLDEALAEIDKLPNTVRPDIRAGVVAVRNRVRALRTEGR